MNKKERLPIVDILTIIATILVVMGHHKFLRNDISWYPIYDKIIYSFHMGFFMVISGFLVRYSFPEDCHWVSYVCRKAKKFIPAYFTVGLLAALISSQSIGTFVHNILMLVVCPVLGPIQIIWYIYVLFMYYCLAPFLFKLTPKYRYSLFAISLVFASFSVFFTPFFCIRSFIRMMPFFLLGSHIADNYKKFQAISDRTIFLAGVPFVAFVIVSIILNNNAIPNRLGYGKLLTSMMSLPLMYWIGRKLMRVVSFAKNSTRFSPYVYYVYLWQIFFIEGIWKVWQKTHLTLNEATSILYLIFSVSFTILGIVIMMKSWRWLSVKIRKPKL